MRNLVGILFGSFFVAAATPVSAFVASKSPNPPIITTTSISSDSKDFARNYAATKHTRIESLPQSSLCNNFYIDTCGHPNSSIKNKGKGYSGTYSKMQRKVNSRIIRMLNKNRKYEFMSPIFKNNAEDEIVQSQEIHKMVMDAMKSCVRIHSSSTKNYDSARQAAIKANDTLTKSESPAIGLMNLLIELHEVREYPLIEIATESFPEVSQAPQTLMMYHASMTSEIENKEDENIISQVKDFVYNGVLNLTHNYDTVESFSQCILRIESLVANVIKFYEAKFFFNYLTIANATKMMQSINLTDFIYRFFERYNVPVNPKSIEKIIVYGKPYFKTVDYLILHHMPTEEAQIKEELRIWLTWRAARATWKLDNPEKTPPENKKKVESKCYELINPFLGQAISHFFTKKIVNKDVEEDVKLVYVVTRDAIIDRVQNSSIFSEEVKFEITKKLDNIKLAIGAPRFVKSAEKVLQYYGGSRLNYSADTQFSEIYATGQRAMTIRRLKRLSTQQKLREWGALSTEVETDLNLIDNEYRITTAALTPPIYTRKRGIIEKYAVLSQIIANDMLYFIGSSYTWKTLDGNLPASNQLACFSRQRAKAFKKAHPNKKLEDVPGENTEVDFAAYATSLDIASEVFLDLAEHERTGKFFQVNHTTLRFYQVDLLQMFMAKFTHLGCESSKLEPGINDFSTRTVGALASSMYFARVFQCETTARKCDFWNQ